MPKILGHKKMVITLDGKDFTFVMDGFYNMDKAKDESEKLKLKNAMEMKEPYDFLPSKVYIFGEWFFKLTA